MLQGDLDVLMNRAECIAFMGTAITIVSNYAITKGKNTGSRLFTEVKPC